MLENANELEERLKALENQRAPIEDTWRDIIRFVMPHADSMRKDYGQNLDIWAHKSAARERGREIFDATALTSADRLTNAVESLISPANERWHGLEGKDMFAQETTEQDLSYYDRLNTYLFQVRYAPQSGFVRAHQKALRSCVGLGSGIIYVEEAFGVPGSPVSSLPFKYMFVPLTECFMATDRFGQTDTLFRKFEMSATNIARLAEAKGTTASDRVMEASTDPKRKDKMFTLVHAVYPREDYGKKTGFGADAPFASVYYEKDTKHILSENGYGQFPFVIYHWAQPGNAPYAESPFHLALSEIKSLNLIGRNMNEATNTWARPPMGVVKDKRMGRPNLNPGALNVGAIDENGRQLIQPLRTLENPSFAQSMLETKRNDLKELLYLNLFRTLIDASPNETATSVLQRSKEKADLFGPIGARIQEGLSRLVDIEFSILARKGAFKDGSPLAPPEHLRGRDFGVRFSSPLDRERRAQELMAAKEVKAEALEWLQAGKSDAVDMLDEREFMKLTREITGAPSKLFKDTNAFEEEKAEKERAMQAEQAALLAQKAGGAGMSLASGVQAVSDGGIMESLQEALGGGDALVESAPTGADA